MENVFCTVLSSRRLYQALALIRSLKRQLKDNFIFHVLCTDDQTYMLLKALNWKNLRLTHENEINQEILSLKKKRKLHEYCWTLKPVLIEKLIEQPFVNRVTYLDSDLYFWESPDVIYKKQPNCSVLLTRQKISRKKIRLYGKYNSGFLSFKKDKTGLNCLRWWKHKCLESCVIDRGKFGDQLYLDEMPVLFPGVCDVKTPGVNIGPWDYREYHFQAFKNNVFVNRKKLIFFHFSGLRILGRNKFKSIHCREKNLPFIFKIYQYELNKVIAAAKKVNPTFDGFANNEDLKYFSDV